VDRQQREARAHDPEERGHRRITENIARIGTIRELEAGRHIVQQDVTQAAMVAVIGPTSVKPSSG